MGAPIEYGSLGRIHYHASNPKNHRRWYCHQTRRLSSSVGPMPRAYAWSHQVYFRRGGGIDAAFTAGFANYHPRLQDHGSLLRVQAALRPGLTGQQPKSLGPQWVRPCWEESRCATTATRGWNEDARHPPMGQIGFAVRCGRISRICGTSASA